VMSTANVTSHHSDLDVGAAGFSLGGTSLKSVPGVFGVEVVWREEESVGSRGLSSEGVLGTFK